ncbi:hypothetical protein FQR65_LT20582 [Abscondita terminalis]|nr:hypothetical protein FQR65_LT20582 [Abscondita terminalis]
MHGQCSRPVSICYTVDAQPQPDQAPAQAESAGDGARNIRWRARSSSSAQARGATIANSAAVDARPSGQSHSCRSLTPNCVLAGAEPPCDVDHRATQGPLRPAGDLRFRHWSATRPPRLPVRAQHVANIKLHHPTLWNSWRAACSRQLYTETQALACAGPGEPGGPRGADRQTQTAALDKLVANGIDGRMPSSYGQLGETTSAPHRGDVAGTPRRSQPDDGTPLVALITGNHQREFESGCSLHLRRRPARFLRGHRGPPWTQLT